MIIAQLIAKFRAYLAYRRNCAILAGLTDRELHDIGINRADIEYAVRHAVNA